MEHLDLPDETVWDERRLWFEAQEAARSRSGAPAPSEQACALMIDLQAVFCAGAWAAAVILASAIVESQGPTAGPDRSGPSLEDLGWLRDLRNRLLHENPRDPALTINDQWTARKAWERHARRAVVIALSALYPGPAIA
jgi:hypothetical protein